MKVMFLNIFEGCQEKERLEKIINFVTKEDPDVLGLSELYGWEKDDFAKLKFFLKQTGFNYHVFCKSTNGFHVGIFSKHQFDSSTDISQGVGMAKAKAVLTVGGTPLAVVVAHLSAIDEDTRLKEVDIILRQIKNGEPTILMGDLNSLSPLDGYDETRVFAKMKNAGMEKFGKNHLRKEVIEKIMGAGFIDAAREYSRDLEYSVPTAYCKDQHHFTKLRLDYLFIANYLRGNLKSAKIVRTMQTNQLSDHFPLLAEFTL